jgi:hypothetical protein
MVKNVRWIEQAAGLALIGAIVFGCWVVLRPFLTPFLIAAFTFAASIQTAVTWLHAQSKEGLPALFGSWTMASRSPKASSN